MFENLVQRWIKNDQGIAAVESAFIFPILLIFILGIVDTGKALIVNKKLINASQMVSDILARNNTISDDDISDAIISAELALEPYSSDGLGIDIASVLFEGGDADPNVEWRELYNTDGNGSVEEDSVGLGGEGEGVLVVTLTYTYSPPFSSFAIGDIEIEEVSFVRGRDTPFIARE